MKIPFDIICSINEFFDDCKNTIKISHLSSFIFENRKNLKLYNIGKVDTLLYHHIHEKFDIEYLNLSEYNKLFKYHLNYENFDFFQEIKLKYPKFKFFLCCEKNKKNIPKDITHLYIDTDVNLDDNWQFPENLLYLHYLGNNLIHLNLPKSLIHLTINRCEPIKFFNLPHLRYIDFKGHDKDIISY